MIRTPETLDESALRELLRSLAREAQVFRFAVAPNPCVGACVLSGAREVARGFHEAWGEGHAEVRALDIAQKSPVPPTSHDTLVVTLEPCSTTGKTPPCTERILAAGIKRVVCGALDPDPRHRGAGLRILREQGVDVELIEEASPLRQTAPYFVRWTGTERLRRPRPWTIAKWAQTRSGQLVPPPEVGGGRWISGPESLAEVHLMRSHVDAIVSGVSTVLRDDPRFSVRPPAHATRAPLRVILDSYLRTPPTSRMFAAPGPGESAGPVHVLCSGSANPERYRALVAAGATVTSLHSDEDDRLRLRDVQAWLWSQGVRRVLLESGPQLLTRYFEHGFVDQVRVYTGNVNGGQGESMAQWLTRLSFEARLDRECGDDSVFEAFVVPRE